MAPRSLAPLDVPDGVRAVVGPDRAALPPGVRIVDAPVHAARIEAERVGDAQDDELPGVRQEGEQRVGSRAGGDRHVRTQAERVELVDPVVVVEVGAAVGGDALHLRSRRGVEGPAFGAVLAGGVRTVPHRAPAAVEAGEVAAAGQRGPDDAVAVYVDPARRVPLDRRVRVAERRLVVLRDARRRRVVADREPHDLARHASRRRPDDVLGRRVGHDAVPAAPHLAVPRRIRVFAVAGPRADPPVAGGVDDGGAPALRGLRVAGLLVDPGVDPADDVAYRAEVQRVVLVEAELQMVGVEAGVDQLHVSGGRVVVRRVARRAGQRVVPREGVAGALPAPRRVAGPADLMRHPDPAPAVHHRVVRVAGVVPEQFVAEVEGGVRHLPGDVGAIVPLAGRVADRQRHLAGFVRRRIDPEQLVVGELDAVDRAAGVDAGVALVGRDLVVDVGGVAAPGPRRQHDVALAAARARRRLRHLAGGDAVGPVGVGGDAPVAAEPVHVGGHLRGALSGHDPVRPRRGGRVERLRVRDLARRQVPELVAELATLLERVDPVGLRPHAGGDAVAAGAGAGELGRVRHLHQRVPVVGGVDGGGFPRRGRGDRGQVERLARPGVGRRRIGEAVAAHPDLVPGVREIRQHVPSFVVRHDDLDEPGGEVVGLRDHPDPRLGTVRAADDAPDVVAVDGDGRLARGDGAAAGEQTGRGQRPGGEDGEESTGWR